MRTRPLGKTGIEVSELALGTWGLSGDGYGSIPDGEQARIIGRAQAMGISLYETAAHYAHGASESTLGEVLRADEKATVVTRIGTDRTSSPTKKRFDRDYLRQACEKSFERLGTKNGLRTVILLHNPSLRALENGALDVFTEYSQSGDLFASGVSVETREVAEKSLDLGAAVLSFSYNIFHVEPLKSLRARLTEAGTAVLLHSVLSYGILTGRYAPNKDFPYGDHRADRYPDDTFRARLRHLDAVRPLVSGDVETMRGAALRFALAVSAASSVVLGPRTNAQLDQLIRDGQAEPPYLSEGKLAGLEGRLANLGVR